MNSPTLLDFQYCFFRKQKRICASVHRKGRHQGTTSRMRGTHTHTTVLTKQLQLGDEVPTNTDRNYIRPRSTLPPTENGEALRRGSRMQRHHHCQVPQRTIAPPRLPRLTYLAPMCLENRQMEGMPRLEQMDHLLEKCHCCLTLRPAREDDGVEVRQRYVQGVCGGGFCHGRATAAWARPSAI
jgi:hypothetical protein